jgi:hypothetical protein
MKPTKNINAKQYGHIKRFTSHGTMGEFIKLRENQRTLLGRRVNALGCKYCATIAKQLGIER